jgi:hypothetical protein
LESELKVAVADYAEHIEADSYILKTVEVKKDYMELKLQFRLIDMPRPQQREMKRQVVRAIYSYVSQRSRMANGQHSSIGNTPENR